MHDEKTGMTPEITGNLTLADGRVLDLHCGLCLACGHEILIVWEEDTEVCRSDLIGSDGRGLVARVHQCDQPAAPTYFRLYRDRPGKR